MNKTGEFTVRALADRSMGADVISIKQWNESTSLNIRVAVEDAETLATKILRAVSFARNNELEHK